MELVLRDKFAAKAEKRDDFAVGVRQSINPRFPIASLAAGNNQFTAVSDTDHGSAKTTDALTREIPRLAQGGVKHIMLEYPIYPVGSPYRGREDERVEDILSRMNSRPPAISPHEIRANKDLFQSRHDEKGEQQTGLSYANLMIAAMTNGITIHFAGDDRGKKESLQMETLDVLRDEYLSKHKKLDRFAQEQLKDPDFLKKLNWPQGEKDKLAIRIDHHNAWLSANTETWLKIHEEHKARRLGPEAENERAERFIKLAQGEKTVLVFGREHFLTGNDLNEAIDSNLIMDALKKGQTLPRKTPTVEIWDSQREMLKWTVKQGEDISKQEQTAIRIFADSGDVHIPKESQDKYKLSSPPTPMQPQQTPELGR